MEWDDFLQRPAVTGLPLSIIPAIPDPASPSADFLPPLRALLGGRTVEDEALIGVPAEFVDDWRRVLPARVRVGGDPGRARSGRLRIRVIAVDVPGSGPALSRLVRAAHHPLILTPGPNGLLSPATFARMLKSINDCDVVTAARLRRRSWSWWRAAWWTGIQLSDPTSPILLIRRPAFEGLLLESAGPLRSFELIAKLWLLRLLFDEVPLVEPPVAPVKAGPAVAVPRETRADSPDPGAPTPTNATSTGSGGAVPTAWAGEPTEADVARWSAEFAEAVAAEAELHRKLMWNPALRDESNDPNLTRSSPQAPLPNPVLPPPVPPKWLPAGRRGSGSGRATRSRGGFPRMLRVGPIHRS
jgi:hypothetical protein